VTAEQTLLSRITHGPMIFVKFDRFQEFLDLKFFEFFLKIVILVIFSGKPYSWGLFASSEWNVTYCCKNKTLKSKPLSWGYGRGKAQAYEKKTILFLVYFGTHHNNKIHTIFKQTSVFVFFHFVVLLLLAKQQQQKIVDLYAIIVWVLSRGGNEKLFIFLCLELRVSWLFYLKP
jgi:hypothetical protein